MRYQCKPISTKLDNELNVMTLDLCNLLYEYRHTVEPVSTELWLGAQCVELKIRERFACHLSSLRMVLVP